MKECLGSIDWVFNPQHVWNVLNMEDRTRTEINKQLKCITNALWPTLLNMQGWRAVVSNWKKNPVLPVLEPSVLNRGHILILVSYLVTASWPNQRPGRSVEDLHKWTPSEEHWGQESSTSCWQQRRATNASTKGESHEIQISTFKMVKTAQKTVSEGQKGKVDAYSKTTKQNSLALKANRPRSLSQLLSHPVQPLSRSLYLSKPWFPHL